MARKLALYLAAVLGMAAFLLLIKLMNDMTGHMARMTDQVTTMTGHMETLTGDVHGMRQSVDRMSVVLQRGSQQIEQLNPMDMMQGVVPGRPGR